MNATTINEVLEVPEVPNIEYKASLKDIDFEWLRDTIMDPTKRDHVYWATGEASLVLIGHQMVSGG